MSSSGGAGHPENSKRELIALTQLGSAERRMDWSNGDCSEGKQPTIGSREQPSEAPVKKDSSAAASEWHSKGQLPTVEKNSWGLNEGGGGGGGNEADRVTGGGGGGGRGGRSRRRRHSEKSPRFPRVKRGLVKQMSEDSCGGGGGGGGHVNLYFDFDSELGLVVDAPPECGSRRSMSEDQRTCTSLRPPPTRAADSDRPRSDPPATASSGGGGVVVGDGESSSSLAVESKDGGGCGGGVDVSLGVGGELREYSPSPGAGDTQPLLLDEGSSESSLRIVGEIVLPFLLAGFGCVFAGLVLDLVKKRPVFVEVSEFFILVPALLGLKGNLEMTLASRLSTQANLGHMDTTAEQLKMIGGNLALTQAQAIIVGLLAAIFAMILGWAPQQKFHLMQGFLLCTGSVLTAAVASFLLGSVMVGVIMLSRKLHINPDNIATPIAASLGDLVTISLLAGIATLLFNTLESSVWLTPTFLFLVIAFIPLWWIISHKNRCTHDVLYTGWTPVIGAMIISSLGGLILDYTVVRFEGVAAFQPVINGVGGNLAAVQASRLSTALHKVSTLGHLPENAVHGCPNPITTFCGKSASARTARVLVLMVIPGQLIFMVAIYFLRQSGDTRITAAFVSIYLTAALLQVVVLLYIANGLVHFLWKRGNDPDNSSIPYLTAIGDLLGTLLLALAFFILSRTDNGQTTLEPETLRNATDATTVGNSN